VIAGVADTHAALWYPLKNPSLSIAARRFMDDAAAAGQDIAVSPVSLAESCDQGLTSVKPQATVFR
jgi:PIN domain nuclease of toxin-antitoxin system